MKILYFCILNPYKMPNTKSSEIRYKIIDRCLRRGDHSMSNLRDAVNEEFDITRGIFQCIEYKAILEALSKADGTNAHVKAILVTGRTLSDLHKRLIGLLCIDVQTIGLNTKCI